MKNWFKFICITLLWSALTCGISFSAKLYLEPSSWELIANCPNTIQIMLDTENMTTNTVDVKLVDNGDFIINSISDRWAIFGSYTKSMHSKIRQWDNKWKNAIYMLGTNPWIGRFNWDGIFANIDIIPQIKWKVGGETGGETELEKKRRKKKKITIDFYMIPNQNWDDSNVSIIQWDKIIDTLDKARWGEYSVVEGECPIINSWYNTTHDNDELKNTDYYLKHLDELEEKNILFTPKTQEKIRIKTTLVTKSKIEIFWIKILNFFTNLFSKT